MTRLIAALLGLAGYAVVLLVVPLVVLTVALRALQEPPVLVDYEQDYIMERALRVGWEKEAKMLADSVRLLHVKHNTQGLSPACRWPPYNGWDSAR
jgi:hypothetical protein